MTPSSGTLPHPGRSYSLLPGPWGRRKSYRALLLLVAPRVRVCRCGTRLTFSNARPLAADTSSAPVLYAPPDRIYFSGQATEVTGSPPLPQPHLSSLRGQAHKTALVTQACGTSFPSWPKRKGLELRFSVFILPRLALLSDSNLNG